MSRIYAISGDVASLIEDLKANKVAGLKHHANESEVSKHLWPDGVTDGINFCFFESTMVLAWGANDEGKILNKLKRYGFPTVYLG